ncbi:MAG: flagellar export chaperone FliS [Bdellovibrionaceae bacterium]|jgi:flagellar secretion chaperone FliS|nr:flagellar export chaperone FliS [Pseudobdellovibrionaceae bacterium]
MNRGYQKYKSANVESASREKLLLLLYEGAIKHIKKSMLAVEANNIAERGTNIGRAYDIIMELNNTLNHEVGGEIAKNLEQLYMFITEQLTQANIDGSKEPLENALKVTTTLYEGWKIAIEDLKKKDNSALKELKIG